MDLTLRPGEQAFRERFAVLFARESTPERVRAAEPLGFDGALWREVVAAGAIAHATEDPERGLLELALVAEVAGEYLAPVPLVEAAAAARLLARLSHDAAGKWLSAARDRGAVIALALAPAEAGVARLVPAGAVADAVIVRDGDALLVAGLPGGAPHRENLGASPLADCRLPAAERSELARGASTLEHHARALDDWRVLTAAALVGLAAGAVARTVAHVKQREQFGVPIGSFQAVQHRLADVATDVDGARLLAQEAAWSRDEALPEAPQLAAMAYLFAARVAERAASEALHFHGGLGFALEGDVQLHFRRAKAWALALDDPRRELARLADLLFGPPEAACTSA